MLLRQSPTAPPQYVRDSKVPQVQDRALFAPKLDEYFVSGVWHLSRLRQKLGGRSQRLHFTDPFRCVRVPWHCRICVIGMRTCFDLKVLP